MQLTIGQSSALRISLRIVGLCSTALGLYFAMKHLHWPYGIPIIAFGLIVIRFSSYVKVSSKNG